MLFLPKAGLYPHLLLQEDGTFRHRCHQRVEIHFLSMTVSQNPSSQDHNRYSLKLKKISGRSSTVPIWSNKFGNIELNTVNQNLPCSCSQRLDYSSHPQTYFSSF